MSTFTYTDRTYTTEFNDVAVSGFASFKAFLTSELHDILDEEYLSNFLTTFVCKWQYYELQLERSEDGTISDSEFTKWVTEFTNLVYRTKDAYIEQIEAYKKEFDWQDGITITRESSQNATDYAMPNKLVSTTTDKGYATSKNDIGTESTVKGSVNLVRQRTLYLNSVRNLTDEYVMTFQVLFYTMF